MKQFCYYFLLLSPVLAVAGSDNEGSPSNEKEGAKKPASSENRPAAAEVPTEDSRAFLQQCNAFIDKVAADNPKITALKGKLIEICEKKYGNYFKENPKLTGSEAFAIVEKDLKAVCQSETLEGNALLEAFKTSTPEQILEGELQEVMKKCSERIDTFTKPRAGQLSVLVPKPNEKVTEHRSQILEICKNLFKTWYHDRTNQPERTVAELIEERLQLLMTACAANYNEADLSALADPAQSTQDIRKNLLQIRPEVRLCSLNFGPRALEDWITLYYALNLGLSQTKPDQKEHIYDMIEEIEKPYSPSALLTLSAIREIYWGKYSGWATLNEKKLGYKLFDVYLEEIFRSQKYKPALPNERYRPDPEQSVFTLAKIMKYSIDPENTLTETVTQLEKDLEAMLSPKQKNALFHEILELDKDQYHRVLLVGRLPFSLKGLGALTKKHYEDIVRKNLDKDCSAALDNYFIKDSREADLDDNSWHMYSPPINKKIFFGYKNRSVIQNLHKELFYEKTLERLEQIGLLSSEKKEALLNLEAEDLGQSRKILKKD